VAQIERRTGRDTLARLEVLEQRLTGLEDRMTEREALNGVMTARLENVAGLAEGTRNAMGRLETRTGDMQRELHEIRDQNAAAKAQRDGMVAKQKETLDALNSGFAGMLGKLNRDA
jgi:predicted  nucleic acid-binding Zn-ribbon protein